jgi:hypothetical protein
MAVAAEPARRVGQAAKWPMRTDQPGVATPPPVAMPNAYPPRQSVAGPLVDGMFPTTSKPW